MLQNARDDRVRKVYEEYLIGKKKRLSKGFRLSMKKRSKYIVKKSHRIKFITGHCFRFSRSWRTMIQIRTRQNARKRICKQIGLRENSQCNFPDIHANIFQGEEVIPEELLIDVLSRLPLKTRARFKCVSKQWERLILNDVPLANAPKLLYFNLSNSGFYFLTMDNETYVESVSMPVEKHLSRDQKVDVRSSCHGLVLVQIDNDLYLWNPLTNFFRKVLTIGGIDCGLHLADLCYCSVNDEYKVVLAGYRTSFVDRCLQFYVATCGDKSWERIENVDLEYVKQGPFFKGYRHWISNDLFRLSEGRIIYFDPSMNKLIDIATPQPKNGVEDTFCSLGVLDGCLSMTRTDDPYYLRGNVELLVMKEYGNGNSWEVMFVFSNSIDELMKPLFRTKKGELLVGTNRGCPYYRYIVKSYDDRGNFLKDIWNKTDSISYKVICYEESWSSPIDIKSYV